jgi:general secretion pathway protein E
MRYPLPYAFARTHQLLLEDDTQQLTLWTHAGSQASALSEVCRKFPRLTLASLGATELVQRISMAYAQGG